MRRPTALSWLVAVYCGAAAGLAAPPDEAAAHPLEPIDRSSPRAMLRSFLEGANAEFACVADYVGAPSRAKWLAMHEAFVPYFGCLDLSEVPPASRQEMAMEAATALFEILTRIELPPFDEIPDAAAFDNWDQPGPPRWRIPRTEIIIARVEEGPAAGEFRFSAPTVARASEFFEKVRDHPYVRPVRPPGPFEVKRLYTGWLIHPSWIDRLPPWLKADFGQNPLWKLVALGLLLLVVVVLVGRVFLWLSRQTHEDHPLRSALLRLVSPLLLLALAPVVAHLAVTQINVVGPLARFVLLAADGLTFVAGAWALWVGSSALAELIISSPQIPVQSINAHLIRVFARLAGLVGVIVLVLLGSNRVGIPVYGVVAGLGVGGLAVALAAQPTIENLIGGLNLFADRPVRVGDFFRYGDELGTVEAIGIRSTRIRGLDRTLTTIPNAALSRMEIVNLSQRDQMLIRTKIGLRYETSPEQLRYVLAKLREMLLGHPRIRAKDMRVRLIDFGSSSLDVELYAYALTDQWLQFLGIQEDVLLRVIDIVHDAGTGFAFPSTTVYLARDGGLDTARCAAAEQQVAAWRAAGRLPFPDFPVDRLRQIRGTVDFPPHGSPGADVPNQGAPPAT